MQEFIKLLGEANRSTEPGWYEGLAIKGSFLYLGTGIFVFAVRLVLMDGVIGYLYVVPPLGIRLFRCWFVLTAPGNT